MEVIRVSEHFKILRKLDRQSKQIKVDQYLESIQPKSSSLKREITRKSNLVL